MCTRCVLSFYFYACLILSSQRQRVFDMEEFLFIVTKKHVVRPHWAYSSERSFAQFTLIILITVYRWAQATHRIYYANDCIECKQTSQHNEMYIIRMIYYVHLIIVYVKLVSRKFHLKQQRKQCSYRQHPCLKCLFSISCK